MNAYAEFAAIIAHIRVDLQDLALTAERPDRTVMTRAAAALALFESDMLRKAAGPILPGEPIS